MNINIDRMREEAEKSPCKVIKFSASDGNIFSHNGEFYANCENCKRTEIEQSHPDCRANHAEWGVLAKSKALSASEAHYRRSEAEPHYRRSRLCKPTKSAIVQADEVGTSGLRKPTKSADISRIYIFCMTPDGKDYPFSRFWCQTCAILLPMFGAKYVFMWNGNEWITHYAKNLIKEVNH